MAMSSAAMTSIKMPFGATHFSFRKRVGKLFVQIFKGLHVSARHASLLVFLRRFQAIENLSKRDQQAVIRTIEAFISKPR